MPGEFHNNSIFWVEVEKIKPNPYQPRREFDQDRLNDLAESIRQYGVLQPLTVTRRERFIEGEGMEVEYELIAGERRHRASKIAGLTQVPVLIRMGEHDDKVKLELAIIENLQREDLNPIERARAFNQLANEFGFKHADIGRKIGKSREYVSNSIRLLTLPDDIQQSVISGRITEGHARPIMMLKGRPEEQQALFKEVIYKKLTVREAETIARKIATDKVRKMTPDVDPELIALEKRLSESFGTRVHIETKDVGGKIVIDFFSNDDIKAILSVLSSSIPETGMGTHALLNKFIEEKQDSEKNETAMAETGESVEIDESVEIPDSANDRGMDDFEEDTPDISAFQIRDDRDNETEGAETYNNEETTSEEEPAMHTNDEIKKHEMSEEGDERSHEHGDALEADVPEERSVSAKKQNDEEDIYSVMNFSI